MARRRYEDDAEIEALAAEAKTTADPQRPDAGRDALAAEAKTTSGPQRPESGRDDHGYRLLKNLAYLRTGIHAVIPRGTVLRVPEDLDLINEAVRSAVPMERF